MKTFANATEIYWLFSFLRVLCVSVRAGCMQHMKGDGERSHKLSQRDCN